MPVRVCGTFPLSRHKVNVMANAPAEDLCQFIDRSPSPFHVCATVAAELETAGFARLEERAAWPTDQGRYYLIRGGSLIAWSTEWSTEASTPPTDAFRIVGGHTDSPNLRLKQHHDLHQLGLAVVALEPYGGAWLNSWLDRDLGISGRLGLRDGTEKLVHIDEPVLRVPQLAIHLSEDRKGVQLDPQRHVNAIWGSGHGTDFLTWIGAGGGGARRHSRFRTHDPRHGAKRAPWCKLRIGFRLQGLRRPSHSTPGINRLCNRAE